MEERSTGEKSDAPELPDIPEEPDDPEALVDVGEQPDPPAADDAPHPPSAPQAAYAKGVDDDDDDDVVVVFAGTPAVVPAVVPAAAVTFTFEAASPDGPPPGTPRTPKHLHPAPFNRTLSMDPNVRGSQRSSGSAASLARQLPPPSYEDVVQQDLFQQSVRSPSVWLKIAQFSLGILCLGLISDGYRLVVSQNVTAMYFPFIVFSAYTLITGVILLSYVMGMKMRELLMRIFGAMGGLLFLISGIHTTNQAVVYWENWQGIYEEGETEENPVFEVASIPRRRLCFVAQVALSFVASVIYLGDVFYSYCRTMQMLN